MGTTGHGRGWRAGLVLLSFVLLVVGCRAAARQSAEQRKRRAAMVRSQIAARGVRDPNVLRAMRRVPRHLFVPVALRRYAYADRPLPIGYRQTISQPYIVAYMTEAIRPKRSFKVLEIGTGSGYQAAVLSRVVKHVYSVEIVRPLALRAKQVIKRLGYRNVTIRVGDGYQGWAQKGPFDAILVTAAPAKVPPPLLAQLKVGGRLVMPVGSGRQELIRMTRTRTGYRREHLFFVRFVPMTGEAQRPRSRAVAPSR